LLSVLTHPTRARADITKATCALSFAVVDANFNPTSGGETFAVDLPLPLTSSQATKSCRQLITNTVFGGCAVNHAVYAVLNASLTLVTDKSTRATTLFKDVKPGKLFTLVKFRNCTDFAPQP
jgi:hypothetical protein